MDIEVEIADRYWPYEKQRCESGPREDVAQETAVRAGMRAVPVQRGG